MTGAASENSSKCLFSGTICISLSLALTMTCLDFDIPAFDTSLQGEIQYSVGRQAVLNKSKKTLGILSNHMHFDISPGHWL